MRRHPGDPARAREPDRHALVSEDRRPRCSSATPISPSRSRRAPPTSSSTRGWSSRKGESRVPGRAASRSSAARDRPTRSPPRGRSSASRPDDFADRHRDAAARVQGQLVSRRCRAARHRRSGRTPVSSSSAKARCANRSKRRRASSAWAIDSCSSGSPKMSAAAREVLSSSGRTARDRWNAAAARLGDRFVFVGFARDVAIVLSASISACFRRSGRAHR